MQVLIVDDEPRSALLLKDLVQKFYENEVDVAIAHTAKDAIHHLKTNRLDLLLLDVEINGRSAFDLLDKIPALDFPFIITSASRAFAFQTFEYGGSGYLLKPLHFHDVNATLGRLPGFKPLSHSNPPLARPNDPDTHPEMEG
ncbi:MAG TPA: response regulator [Catalimonadaceae bacterium]|jgi:response regulator of citrate/malate metabolism|nr:response regulator [Catalimonadaceae bacterium]